MIAYQGTLLTILLIISLASGQEEDPTLKITPSKVAAQVGENAEFECSFPDNESLNVFWLFPNNTAVNQSLDSRYEDSDGTLSISDLVEGDEGEYICTTLTRDMNATATLKIYVMPSYFTEAMIVMGINIVLVLIFIGCGINQYVQTRKEKKTNLRKPANLDI